MRYHSTWRTWRTTTRAANDVGHLLQRRAAIEGTFGGPLRWFRAFPIPGERDVAPALVTKVICPGLGQLPREQWPAVQAAMIDAMVRLEQAVAPHVAPWLPE